MTAATARTTVADTDLPAVRLLMLSAFQQVDGAGFTGTDDGQFYLELPLPTGGVGRFWEQCFGSLALAFARVNNITLADLSAEDGATVAHIAVTAAVNGQLESARP